MLRRAGVKPDVRAGVERGREACEGAYQGDANPNRIPLATPYDPMDYENEFPYYKNMHANATCSLYLNEMN